MVRGKLHYDYLWNAKCFCNSDYSGLDPEVANNGVDNTIYRQRSILGGVNVNI
jgi:hypothetical protein